MLNYSYIAPHRDLGGKPDRNHDRREATFDLLEEAAGHLGDAWVCLWQARKGEVYFEPDEEDVREIEEAVNKLSKQFQKIVERYEY